MNKRILPLLLLAMGCITLATAQTKEKPKVSKEQSITIRKKGDAKEKMTIVVDGDNITVNGKPLEDLKDTDIEILRNSDHIRTILPKIKGRLAPLGSLKMMGDDFPFGGNRAFLGVVTEKNEKGAKITSVEKESAAEKTGLTKDDIITQIGDTKIENSEDLYDAVGQYKPGDKITINYLRDGKPATATATLGKSKSAELRFNLDRNNNFNFEMPDMPRIDGRNFNFNFSDNRKPRLGIGIQDLAEGKGVKILDVEEDTPAAKAGLQKDDVIIDINGSAVNSVDELKGKVKDLKEGDSVKLSYQRAGKTQTAEIKFPKKLKTAEL
ncbi:MAG TPA: PDZ domain-containing protein [Sediminibacterium sp.]